MHKFNDNGILTGYIKQVLKDFNLPKLKVYTQKYQDYFNKYGTESEEILSSITSILNKDQYPTTIKYSPYIKDGKIQEYINGKWETVGFRSHNKITHEHFYTYGNKILNYTKNLQIKNNLYDSYTHEYLGDYLRFHRDFANIDLMSLYNCFSNRVCEKLDLKFDIIKLNSSIGNSTETRHSVSFNSADSLYKIYMVPIKLFQEYTIAVDSELPIEICCGMYGEYQDSREKFKNIPRYTYHNCGITKFANPIVYNKLTWENIKEWVSGNKEATNDLIEILQNEADLKLFIKIPMVNKSSIVILEGDYLNWNDSLYKKNQSKIIKVDFYDKSNPTSITAKEENEGKVYLNTTSGNVYKCYKLTTNKELKYYWGFVENIWGITIKENFNWKSNTIIDENNYTELDTNKSVEENIKLYSLYYKKNSAKKISTKYTAYINTNIKATIKEGNKERNQYVVLTNIIDSWNKQTNYSVINIENLTNEADVSLKSPLQLLQLNTGESSPFADRLIEYLLENAISNSENEIADNVKRTQKIIELNSHLNSYKPQIKGLWDSKMSKILYEYMTTHSLPTDIKHDLLGYADKDVEKYYTSTIFKNNKNISTSLLNIELDEEDN